MDNLGENSSTKARKEGSEDEQLIVNPSDDENSHKSTSKEDMKTKVRMCCLIVFLCLYSMLHTARIICSPVILTYLKIFKDNDNLRRADISWISKLYEMLSFFLVPIFCGIIDKFGIGYRVTILVSVCLQLIGNIAAALAGSIDELPVTYSFIPGIASALAIGTIILIVDEFVGESSKYRIIATTYCQGTISATFFFSYMVSLTLEKLGWKNMNFIGAALFATFGIIVIILIPEQGLKFRTRRLETSQSDEKSSHLKKPLSDIILGVSSSDTVASPALLIWLLYRLLHTINKIGVYIHTSKNVRDADATWLILDYFGLNPTAEIISGYLFSSGEVLTFLIGALLGQKLKNHLNHIYALSSMFLFFFFIVIYLITFIKPIEQPLDIFFQLNFFLSGCAIGFQDTFAFAASQEATLIPARRIYPFTQITTGLAFIISPILEEAFSYSKQAALGFLIYSIFSIVNSGLILFILYRNYNYKAMLKRQQISNMKLKINAIGSSRNFE